MSASHLNFDFLDISNDSGQWYADNGLFVGAGYAYANFDLPLGGDDSSDIITGNLDYQDNEVWSVSATFADPEDGDNITFFDVSYEHDLVENDWLAFQYSTDDEFDFLTVNTRYYNSLDNGSYIQVTASVIEMDEGSGD